MTAAPSVVRALPSVALEELVERASLQTRIDRKYVLRLTAATDVLTALAAAEEVRVLEIGTRRGFGYESLYYDTAELTSYHLAARGRRRRFKVRRRTYLDSGESYIEVKTRGIRGATVKERTPLGAGFPTDFVDDVLRRAGIESARGADLRPVLSTSYRRSTLYLPATDVRVTIDTGLTWSFPGHPGVGLSGLAVVETKSSAAASTADRLLWRHGHRPTRISKYGTGLAVLRDDLPSNKWRPVLRRHVTPPRPADDRNPS